MKIQTRFSRTFIGILCSVLQPMSKKEVPHKAVTHCVVHAMPLQQSY